MAKRLFKRLTLFCITALCIGSINLTAEDMRWPAEKARQWYDKQPWLSGFNFTPSTAVNQLEMWQQDTFDPETIDRELGWAHNLGFNTVRVYLHDLLWHQDSEGFLKRIDKFLEIADHHNIKVMFVLLDSCWDPFPHIGKQHEPVPHLHNSGWVQSPHIDILKDPEKHDQLKSYIQGVIKHFRDDERIVAWDIYNEPGNRNWLAYGRFEPENKSELQLKLLTKAFQWAREANPCQPITAAVWAWEIGKDKDKPALNKFMLENSDIITFHNYSSPEAVKDEALQLKEYERPILCTEYMNRDSNNTVITLLPFFKEHKIGAYNWGFAAGKIQTQYPWKTWEEKFDKEPQMWFHDLLRPDGSPFDAAEAAFIRRITNAPGVNRLKPLFDFPVRDTCICLGPDDTYYLIGTTGFPTWWQTNEGARIWKSKDLKTWEPVGLVWSFDKDATWQKPAENGNRAMWAPELHYINGTFWIAYCMNYGGTGILKSTSGKAEGPYVDIKTDGPLTNEIDASLFADDDGKVYFIYQNGKIARMKDDMSGLAEEPRLLKPANAQQVGFEGAFLFKANGRYYLSCADFTQGRYHCYVASSKDIYGPYSKRYLAIPHGGHNMFFRDKNGDWWSSFFGNDGDAPFRERPGLLPIEFGLDGLPRPMLSASDSSNSSTNLSERRVLLSQLDLPKMTSGWGKPQADKSIESNQLSIAGQKFDNGVGTHADSAMHIKLGKGSKRFTAYIGVDDEVGDNPASICFKIYSENKKLYDSGIVKTKDKAKKIDIDLTDIESIVLLVTSAGDGINYDHSDWADAGFEVTGQEPIAIDAPVEEKIILTPKPPNKPRINGPTIYGVRPGRPFLYRIPATGQRPMKFSAKKLPAGLNLDSKTGNIKGTIKSKSRKTYHTTLTAENSFGKDERLFRIVVGNKIALTPPMGWNHWYIHYNNITDELMRAAAETMIDSSMADVGYSYVNIDDCWMNAPKHYDPNRVGPLRDADGKILPNKYFPDMKALTDYIHSLGLKAGLYTSPGPFTCAGFAGSWGHEKQDAKLFADWGFDFLKYDWCSYGEKAKDVSLDEMKKPYQLMGDILKKLDRDIVFNLCQYGMGEVWKWGEQVGGNCWRTGGDLGFELQNYHDVAIRNASYHPYTKPGAWNDPDYLLLGSIGPDDISGEPIPCPLTPNEQYSYMSLWCLMASPLFFSGDMRKLDDFTLNVICNPEIIEINQDALGKEGYPVITENEKEVWKKELEDGSVAVGLFNRSEFEQKVGFNFKEVGVKTNCRLRDLWRQKDLGVHKDSFEAVIPRHGVVMLRLFQVTK